MGTWTKIVTHAGMRIDTGIFSNSRYNSKHYNTLHIIIPSHSEDWTVDLHRWSNRTVYTHDRSNPNALLNYLKKYIYFILDLIPVLDKYHTMLACCVIYCIIRVSFTVTWRRLSLINTHKTQEQSFQAPTLQTSKLIAPLSLLPRNC
jgi:hypothetical protein